MCIIHVLLSVLLIYTILQTVNGDYWSLWTEWSECSRTCDGGAAYQLRRCIRNRWDPGGGCDGTGIRYKTCNYEACPPDSPDFRAEQCAAHNNERFNGRYLKWIPYHNSVSPCSLYCRAIRTNIRHLFAPKVLDGTRCKSGVLDMCVNGKCWPVGCDKVLGSLQKFDSCGKCGGTNACHRTKRKKKTGRFKWISTGFGPCSTSCGVGHQDIVNVCKDLRTGRTVSNRRCMKTERPSRHRRKCIVRKCLPSWFVGPWNECTQTCGGGYAWRIVRCIESFLDGTKNAVNDSQCNDFKPSERKSCGNELCPRWYAGQWSPCSVTCGTGHQQRDVICRHTGNAECNEMFKPKLSKNCSIIPCEMQADGRYSEYDNKADVQEVMVVNPDEEKSSVDEVIYDENVQENELQTPRFVVSHWGQCSATCGSGVRRRYVRCKVYLSFLEDVTDLPDEDCKDDKPAEIQSCFLGYCLSDFEYRAVGMTACSRSCIGGIQETIMKCVHKSNGSVVDDEFCEEAQLIPIERRVCNDNPCPQRWQVGDFGDCSKSCGNGVMTRNVICIQEFSAGPENILRLPDFICEQPIPQRERNCNQIECPPKWSYEKWTPCSVTCGNGFQTREIYCVKILSNGMPVKTSFTECGNLQQPVSRQSCQEKICPEPRIKQIDVQFFQLNKLKRVTLKIGMKAAVLPGTTIIVKCPTRGIDKKSIVWLKEGGPLNINNKVRVSPKGTLRIKKSMPGRDTGVYSCKSGARQASISITFNTVYDLFQATVLREKYLMSASSGGLKMNMSASIVDPVDKKKKPLHFVQTDWSACSTTCGGGLQARNVSCEVITDDYYEVFPVRYCTKAGFMSPLLIRSCNTQQCVHWNTTTWTKCLNTDCFRNMFSVQRRTVTCLTQIGGHILNDSYCAHLGIAPHDIQECVNVNCTAKWNTSDWTQCDAPCSSKGYRYRMVSCIWTSTGLSAGRHCEGQPMPKTRRRCKSKPCNKCEDKSQYCSIVKMMNFCRYPNYRRSCCHSCNL